jgi:hypothetical protein
MWQEIMVNTLRVMIDDFCTPYQHDDAKLQRLLCLSAQLVLIDLNYSLTYDIRVKEKIISPDPTSGESKNQSFVDLILLKAACTVDKSSLKDAAVGNPTKIKVREFGTDTETDYSGVFEARKKLIEIGWCKSYAEAKQNYLFGNETDGVAVMSPFRVLSSSRENGFNNYLMR